MRKILLFTVMLLCAASMWAADPIIEGPWTQIEMKSHACSREGVASSIMFDTLNNQKWTASTIKFWQDDDGVGYTINGTSDNYSMMAIFSTYKKEVELPSYASLTLTWKYQLRSKSTQHHSATCLYALQGMENDITHLAVDFSNHHDSQTGAEYLLDSLVNRAQDGKTKKRSEKTIDFVFDNLSNSTSRTESWYLLLTHVTGSGDPKSGLHEWGSFKSIGLNTTWTYRKILSFDKNASDATGSMTNQVVIDGSGKLPANAFTREGYVFAGWATSANGEVVYTDQAIITASEDDKGPKTLYAKWTKWGDGKVEGPWTQLEWNTATSGSSPITYNQLDGQQWDGTILNWSDAAGIGYTYHGNSPDHGKMGIFSTYKDEVVVPSYSRLTLTWKFNLYSKSTKHHSSLCLYGLQDYEALKTLSVDFSNSFDETKASQAGANLLAWYTNTRQDGKTASSGEKTAVLNFDNIEGSSEQTKAWYLMMTYTMQSSGGKTGLDEWGYFKSKNVSTAWTYRKIVTFNKNAEAATGEMADQIVDNSGALTANAFTYEGHYFVGWATSANDGAVYTDGEVITASVADKGLVTLYAVWSTESPHEKEGPWTQIAMKTHTCGKSETSSITYNQMNNQTWEGTITPWNDNDGIGFTYEGKSPENGKMGIFSTYKDIVVIPSYSYLKMTWKYQLRSKSTKHHSTTALYGLKGTENDINTWAVDFSNHHDSEAGYEHRLDYFNNDAQNGDTEKDDEQTAVFEFENREGTALRVDTCYLLLTHVVASADGKSGLKEWGSFKSVDLNNAWTYRKVVSFNANGGEGTMANQNIDNSGKLSANTFTRVGYVFAGWATDPNGGVVYSDKVTMTASATDKGPVTLYAVWTADAYVPMEGFWTQTAWKTHACANSSNPSITFNQMDNTKWSGTITGRNEDDGIGFTYQGSSPDSRKMGIFSTYTAEAEVPSYACLRLSWTYQLGSKSTKHHSTTALYGRQGTESNIRDLSVDFSNHYETQTGYQYLLARFTNKAQDGHIRYIDKVATIDFNNREGIENNTIHWNLLLTHTLQTSDGKSGLDEWGTFKSVRIDSTWIYCKIISFNSNGGSGAMGSQIIDNSGNLNPNTFTRNGYTFAGWATSPDGGVAYSEKAMITASATDKGPVTLYAVWMQTESALGGLTQGPWALKDTCSGACEWISTISTPKISFNGLRELTKHWGRYQAWTNNEGLGFAIDTAKEKVRDKSGLFAILNHREFVPAYTKRRLTWTVQLGSKALMLPNMISLYAVPDSLSDTKALEVSFDVSTDPKEDPYFLGTFYNTTLDGNPNHSEEIVQTIDFDNHESDTVNTKEVYLLMTYLISHGYQAEYMITKDSVNEWGAFRHINAAWEDIYYNYVTFNANANDAEGTMAMQTIENSSALAPNNFIREGYTFAGWATSAEGPVVYADEAQINVTAETKGAMTLYAKWTWKGTSPLDLYEGPWALMDTCSGAIVNQDTIFMTFDSIRSYITRHWGAYTAWKNDENGIGFTMNSQTPANETSGFLSVYLHSEEDIPAFTSRRLTWTFKVGSLASRFNSLTELYLAEDSLYRIKGKPVMLAPQDNTLDVEQDVLGKYYNTTKDGNAHYTQDIVQTIDFDNHESDSAQTKHMYLLMAHSIQATSASDQTNPEWGAFRHTNATWQTLYYKLITFNANDTTNTTNAQEIETSGNLEANTFTREGYTFAGWATAEDGPVVYADQAPIKVTAETKGRLELYAVWEPIKYNITYDLGGEMVTNTNPHVYTAEDSVILSSPTRPGFVFLGWTGANGDLPETEVKIAIGSTEDKHFVAHWENNLISATIEKINAIGTVEYNKDCYARIYIARYYYNLLSAADKAKVTNYSTLEAAEGTYEALKAASQTPYDDDCRCALWPAE